MQRIRENRTVVRLITEAYSNKRGFVVSKRLVPLKRKCRGFQPMEADIGDEGFANVYPSIINLYEVEDGVYEVILTDISKDMDGHIDGYNYKLIAFEELRMKEPLKVEYPVFFND